jgi:hypothetical protein
VAPGAKANAVRPHEPSVTLAQSPEYYLALMVIAVSATSVTAYLSLCHCDVLLMCTVTLTADLFSSVAHCYLFRFVTD